jgi:nitrogen fixation NifU-like protein
MKSTQYSEKVLDHFRNPRNVGTLEGEDVVAGETGSHVNGDLMKIYLKVADDTIADVKFQTFGCGSAIATSSMVTELVKGKTLDEAVQITPQDVADELDGLPPAKMHCSNLAVDALREAINNYKSQKGYG